MTAEHRVEIVDGEGTRRLRIEGIADFGRESGDVILADQSVSRLHLRLDATGDTLVATDLGSSNGTLVNGTRIVAPTAVAPGDTIQIGATVLSVLAPSTATAAVPAPSATAGAPATDAASPEAPAAPLDPTGAASPPDAAALPLASGTESHRNDAVEVRYRPGTYGAEIARSYASRVAKARKALAGLGSESWGTVVVFHLVDPFHQTDPASGATEVVSSGTIVDGATNQAWIVVTPEAPPEEPHRALALLYGAALPCADLPEVELLTEGYGLHASKLPDPDEQLAGTALPPFGEADPELRGAMTLSFTRFLIEREGDDALRRALGAPSGRFDETVREIYGVPLVALEQQWRRKVIVGEPDVKTGEFLRLSLRYLRPYKLRQAEIFAYMLLSLAFTAAFPFVTQRLFDTALPSGEFSQVLTLLIALGIAFLISLIAGVRQAYQTAWVSGAVTRDIRQTIFDRAQKLPASWYHDHPQGDLLSRLFSDVGAVEAGLSQAIGQGIFQMLTLVVSGAIMLTINFWLGLIVLVSAPLVGFVYRRMAAGALERSIAVQENSSALLSVAAENYSANPVVKMFGLGSREGQRFAQQGDRLFRSERRLQLWGGLFGLSVNLIVTVLRLFVLGLGAWLILEGNFTIGGLVAFLSIMGEVLSPVTVLVSLSQDVQASMGSLMRINEVVDAEPEPDDPALPALGPVARDIRFVDAALAYTPERRALDQFDVTIPAGSRVAFVGPSGSGKSTVLRLLMRMYEPDEGAILVDGVDLRSASLASWRDQLGVVFQDSFLFDTTLRENIALGKPGATDADIQAAMDAAEIDAFIDNLPRGWDTLVGEGGSNLSGGQRQRVAIARALVRNPSVLVLDEATSALDPATERQINETIERIARQRTVVSVTHRLASITDYDKIVVIVDGLLEEQGTHAELLANRGTYARLWAEQTGQPLPEEPPFDLVAALDRVAFLHGLGDEILGAVAGAMRTFTVDAGRAVDDSGGLIVVERGHGEVVQAASGGGETVTAQLRPGDAFGVASALGAPATAALRAIDPLSLVLLDHSSLDQLAAAHPALAARLAGADEQVPAAGGHRLSRLTLGPGLPSRATLVPGSAATAPAAPIRPSTGRSTVAVAATTRGTGAFPRVG